MGGAMEENRKKKPGQSWADFVEQQIRDAMERGEFDNLPGKGKPQNLTSFAGDPALEMANKIVRDAGFVPAWLELEQEIEREQREAAEALMRSWRWREATRGDAIEDPRWIEAEWAKARDLFEKRLRALNTKILSYNLLLPPPLLHKQRPRLKPEAEYARLGIDNT
jgi:DnaJ family protein C protein 28